MKGTVYLLLAISPEGEEFHKIGITTRPVEQRIKALQTGNPLKISVLRQYKTQNYRKVESTLHKRFRCLSEAKNEWRKLSDEEVFNFEDICKEIDDNINYLLKNNSLYK